MPGADERTPFGITADKPVGRCRLARPCARRVGVEVENLAVGCARRCARLNAELLFQECRALLVQVHARRALTPARVAAHERAPGAFVERIEAEQALRSLNRVAEGAVAFELVDKMRQHGPRAVPQTLPIGLDPFGLAVGQQIARIQLGRFFQRGAIALQTLNGSGFEVEMSRAVVSPRHASVRGECRSGPRVRATPLEDDGAPDAGWSGPGHQSSPARARLRRAGEARPLERAVRDRRRAAVDAHPAHECRSGRPTPHESRRGARGAAGVARDTTQAYTPLRTCLSVRPRDRKRSSPALPAAPRRAAATSSSPARGDRSRD